MKKKQKQKMASLCRSVHLQIKLCQHQSFIHIDFIALLQTYFIAVVIDHFLRTNEPLSVFSCRGNSTAMFTELRLTWGECFPVDQTSQQPNPSPSSGCPCLFPCPRRPLLTKDKNTHSSAFSLYVHDDCSFMAKFKCSTYSCGVCVCDEHKDSFSNLFLTTEKYTKVLFPECSDRSTEKKTESDGDRALCKRNAAPHWVWPPSPWKLKVGSSCRHMTHTLLYTHHFRASG